MVRIRAAVIAIALISAGGAWAQVAPAVERSGATYHVAVCPGPAAPGTARCHAHAVSDAAGVVREQAAQPNLTPSGYGPAALRAADGVTGSGSATTVIAIVDAYGYTNAESDLAVYRSTYGLPPCTTANGCFVKYNQSGVQGSYPRQNTGWAQETALDLDMANETPGLLRNRRRHCRSRRTCSSCGPGPAARRGGDRFALTPLT